MIISAGFDALEGDAGQLNPWTPDDPDLPPNVSPEVLDGVGLRPEDYGTMTRPLLGVIPEKASVVSILEGGYGRPDGSGGFEKSGLVAAAVAHVVQPSHVSVSVNNSNNRSSGGSGGRGPKGESDSQMAARLQREEQARAAARNTLRKEQEWMRRQPKARATKEKARIERFYNLTERAADKGSKTKMVDLVESRQLRMGDIIVEFDMATLAFGDKKILDDFTYSFVKGDKIGLVGPNGAGKTTFLRTIMGEIALDSGWCNIGETIEFGYYSQMPEFRDPTQTVVDFVKEVESDAKGYVGSYGGEGGKMSAYKLLERFNFGGPKQMTRIGDLSGGEQRRLQLLSVLAKCPNFLILDEPTNDLDLDTIEALEEMLEDFDGCVIVVSHDRQFVNNLVDHIFVFEGDGIINDWSGDYTALREFLRRLEEERESAKALTGDPDVNPLDLTEEEIAEAKARAEEERKILKEANNAPKVIEKIEAAIAVLEGNIEEIDARLMDAGSDVSKAQEIQVERDAKASKMQLYYDEWERLEGVLARAEEIRAAQEVPA